MRGMVVGWYIHLWGNQCKKNKECFLLIFNGNLQSILVLTCITIMLEVGFQGFDRKAPRMGSRGTVSHPCHVLEFCCEGGGSKSFHETKIKGV